MTTTGDVEITILDGAAGVVVVPASTVQVVIGVATAGVIAGIVATRSLQTLLSQFTSGPLVEAAALTIQNGGTVLAMRATTATAGTIRGLTQVVPAITGTDTSSPIKITSVAHGLITGDVVTITGVVGQTGANGTFKITKVDADHFTLDGSTSVGVWVSGGAIAFDGVVEIATGTSVITATGTPVDDTFIKFLVVAGGTIGAAGITFQISLDAGRNFGPVLALGTAVSYAIPGTGITLAFAAGTLVAGDYAQLSTIAPTWDDAGIAACLAALFASPYATTGWGSVHIVGVSSAANVASQESTGVPSLDSFAANHVFTGAFDTVRDASPPKAWGGTGETEAAWMSSILTAFSATSAKRVSGAAGFYNMPSAFPTQIAGTPRYRRPLAWAYAAREVAIQPQTHAGRVRDGALSQIVVDPVNDPVDGFIYHDERVNPGLDFKTGGAGRFVSARTRIGLGSTGGFFIVNPLMLSALGSDFWMWPFRAVMDVACAVVFQTGSRFINDDLQTQPNGTLADSEVAELNAAFQDAIDQAMTNVSMISSATVSVSPTQNVNATGIVKVTVTIVARGYVLEEDVTIGFANTAAA